MDPYLFIMNKINPSGCNINILFYDDLLDNLKTAKNLNWKTVWINSSDEESPSYVDYKFDTIIDALLFFIY
jgi:FMN phosphatase YigB (HAD superfamily)